MLKKIIFITILIIVFSIGVYVAIAVNNRGNAPVAYWKFDEGYGTTAYDAAGANDGTITGAQWRNEPDCKFGKCLYFDGDGDYVVKTSATIPSADFTLEAWAKFNSIGTATYAIIQIGDGDNSWELQTEWNGDKLRFFQRTNGQLLGTTSLTTNTWYHLAIANDGGSVSLYVNGILDGSGTKTIDTIDASQIIVGGQDNNPIGDGVPNTYWFHGLIDDVRIYNYARTAEQIRADYLAGAAGRGAVVVQSSKFKVNQRDWLDTGRWTNHLGQWTAQQTQLWILLALAIMVLPARTQADSRRLLENSATQAFLTEQKIM